MCHWALINMLFAWVCVASPVTPTPIPTVEPKSGFITAILGIPVGNTIQVSHSTDACTWSVGANNWAGCFPVTVGAKAVVENDDRYGKAAGSGRLCARFYETGLWGCVPDGMYKDLGVQPAPTPIPLATASDFPDKTPIRMSVYPGKTVSTDGCKFWNGTIWNGGCNGINTNAIGTIEDHPNKALYPHEYNGRVRVHFIFTVGELSVDEVVWVEPGALAHR